MAVLIFLCKSAWMSQTSFAFRVALFLWPLHLMGWRDNWNMNPVQRLQSWSWSWKSHKRKEETFEHDCCFLIDFALYRRQMAISQSKSSIHVGATMRKADVTPHALLYPLHFSLWFCLKVYFCFSVFYTRSAASPASRDWMTAHTQKDFLEDKCERQK